MSPLTNTSNATLRINLLYCCYYCIDVAEERVDVIRVETMIYYGLVENNNEYGGRDQTSLCIYSDYSDLLLHDGQTFRIFP